jgi:nicotinate-nucleotide pyrophosphorylase (carboxylating)
MSVSPLPPYVTNYTLDDLVDRAIREDIGDGDVTTEATVAPGRQAQARFLAKEDGVLAGQFVAERVMHRVDDALTISWTRTDGETIYRGTSIGVVRGDASAILGAERVALNIMQRMSGIATTTRRFVDAVRGHSARILDTRKTAPGLRILDKWAVKLGGGKNHRIGLFDMILIKDNHIVAAGGVANAIQAARAYGAGRNLKIEVEARTLDEVDAVLAEHGVDMILLDNMVDRLPEGRLDVSRLRSAVERIDGRIMTEASGNVTLDTVDVIASTGVDFISSGALTHSVRALDISLQMSLESA